MVIERLIIAYAATTIEMQTSSRPNPSQSQGKQLKLLVAGC